MIYTKGLLLKGLLGFGAASSAVYVGLSQQERIAEFFSGGKETEKPAEITDDLLGNVGLNCPPATAEGVDCSKKEGTANIKVKKGDVTFEVSSLPSSDGSGKIKLYKLTGADANDYNQGLKFVIEGGDINGTEASSDKKLEEFETYEVKQDGSDWKLTLKKKSSEEKRRILGLPDSCAFPETGSTSQPCTISNEDINKIKFDGKDETATITGTGTLQITVATSSDSDFPHGFKFTLTATSSEGITINRGSAGNIVLKNNEGTDFRIKKVGKNLTLEEALTKDALTAKVGLSCTGTPTVTEGVDCSMATGASSIKVKQGEETFTVSNLSGSGSGKIKLYKDEGSDYNKGFKFVIEDNDINGNNSKKLEQFETYEIKEDGTDWKLNRKKKSWEEKRRILGLPDTCAFPEAAGQSPTCSITSQNIGSIKFEDKSSATISGSGTLKITVASSDEATDFPLGYKFTLTPSGGSLTINRSTGTEPITIADGKSKEFKIKQDAQNKKQLTLEEAWTLETLTKKVGLSCTGSTPSETNGVNCTKANGNIKVKKESNTFDLSDLGSAGKIKVYKTSSSEDHNEGFKFVIEGGDVNNSGTNKLEQFETYEIKKETDGWKLVRKSDAKAGIKKALGLDQISGCDLPNQDGCQVDGDKIKKIKFSDGENERADGPSGAKLKITTEEDKSTYPFGYKFVLDSTTDAKISSSLTIKGNTNTEFKIKKTQDSNSISLEKAWSVTTLGEKVGLTCPATQAGDEKKCTLDTNKKINVKDGTGTRKQASFKNGDANKKLTYADNTDGYNQGFKFTAESEICLENGEQSSGNPTSIENGGTGYEIKKDSDGTWYLTKKN